MTDPTQPSDPTAPMPPTNPSPLPPPLPPAPAAPGGAGSPADIGPRLVARIIDGIVLAIVNGIVASILFGGFVNPYAIGFGFTGRFFLYLLIGAAISIAYFAFMESSRGQTIGKIAMSIRTEGPAGGNPTMEQAVKRNAWYALNVIPVIGWLAQLAAIIYIAVTISNSANKVGWHDTFAGGTRVVTTK